MQKSVILLFILFSLGAFIFINSASAGTPQFCNVTTYTACTSFLPTGIAKVVMNLSDSANAHGSIDGTPYPYSLCCYFGTGSTICSDPTINNNSYYFNNFQLSVPQDKIIGLSSSTNAHGEIVNSTVYGDANDVCYSGYQFVSIQSSTCPTPYPYTILSLVNYTNSHIDNFSVDSYNICGQGANGGVVTHNACNSNNQCVSVQGSGASTCSIDGDCNSPPGPTHNSCSSSNKCISVQGSGASTCSIDGDCNPGTCALTSAQWQYTSTAPGLVNLYINGTPSCINENVQVTVNIFDTSGKSPIQQSQIIANFQNNNISVPWTAQYETPGYNNVYNFTAVANTGSTISSSNLLTVTQQSPTYCQDNSVNTCGNYPDGPHCNQDYCNVAKNSDPNPNSGGSFSDNCLWNSSASIHCQFVKKWNYGKVSCPVGYNLCSADQTGGLNSGNEYCYPGNTCPFGDTPDTNNDGTCVQGVGCSNSQCADGSPDSCVSGATCSMGECANSSQVIDFYPQCGNGYRQCYNSQYNLHYCYPGSPCPNGDSGSCTQSTCTPGLTCNAQTGVCTSTTIPIGQCIYSTSTSGGCVNGLLNYSWTAQWSGTGTMPPQCVSGNKEIECPAQIPLPFFTVLNVIATIAVIVIIYGAIALARKSKSHKVHSKNRRSYRKK